MQPFYWEIKKLLHEQKLTVTRVAREIGCRRDQLSMTIRGVREYPKIREDFAKYCKQNVSALFCVNPENSKKAA